MYACACTYVLGVCTAEVCRLALLEDLRVAGNRLATLPAELGALRRLRFLAVP